MVVSENRMGILWQSKVNLKRIMDTHAHLRSVEILTFLPQTTNYRKISNACCVCDQCSYLAVCNESPVVHYDAVIDVTTAEGRCASLSIAQAFDAAFMGAHREQCYSEQLPSVHFDNDVYFKALALVALQANASREAMAVFYDTSFGKCTSVFPWGEDTVRFDTLFTLFWRIGFRRSSVSELSDI